MFAINHPFMKKIHTRKTKEEEAERRQQCPVFRLLVSHTCNASPKSPNAIEEEDE